VKGATIDLDLYVGFRPYVTGIGAFFEMVYSNMFFLFLCSGYVAYLDFASIWSSVYSDVRFFENIQDV